VENLPVKRIDSVFGQLPKRCLGEMHSRVMRLGGPSRARSKSSAGWPGKKKKIALIEKFNSAVGRDLGRETGARENGGFRTTKGLESNSLKSASVPQFVFGGLSTLASVASSFVAVENLSPPWVLFWRGKGEDENKACGSRTELVYFTKNNHAGPGLPSASIL